MIYQSASKTPVRRGQLITPFGIGALVTNQSGVSMICAALDYWFNQDDQDESEFTDYRDERLLNRMGIDHIRRPPDYRNPSRQLDDSGENLGLTVPSFRFPQWHFCPKCRHMRKLPLTVRGRQTCRECGEEKWGRWYGPPLYQLRFVAACDNGHLQDFPWVEWVHRSPSPECDSDLKFKASGGSTLSSVSVSCECGEWRHLGGVTRAYESGDQTYLSEELHSGGSFLCRGWKPWTGSEQKEDCSRPLRATLRNASNLYFANTFSSLFLPPDEEAAVERLVVELRGERFSDVIPLLKNQDVDTEQAASSLKQARRDELSDYTTSEVGKALTIVLSDSDDGKPGSDDERSVEENEDIAYRRQEFEALQEPRQSDMLTIRSEGIESYGELIQGFFSRITLVDRLRETKVLNGFTRLTPDVEEGSLGGREMLWKNQPHRSSDQNWLPASITHGEGIFLEFSEERLARWEQIDQVVGRIGELHHRYQHSRFYDEKRIVTPRFVLVHTFSHLLINRLVFECGYSTAALRERLYVSDDNDNPMAGVLIYTAAGDSDGTMGGLVRMGQPGYLEPVIESAIEEAEWCSADPICMEAAEKGGQGPESLNLAACHNCALTPETSCEEFNRFLDRGVLIGFGGKSNQNAYFGYDGISSGT